MRIKFFTIFVLLILTTAPFYTTSQASTLRPGYKITFLAVNQADAALLQDPSGFTVLIDGGMPDAGPKVVDFIRSQAVDQIDVMVATHFDRDHIGGLVDVLEMTDVPVKSVIYNGYPGTTITWTSFSDAVLAEGLTLRAVQYPQTHSWGLMQVEVLHPTGGLGNPPANDACLVLKVTTGDIKTLFACDISSVEESIILSRPVNLSSQILKVAHHGSDKSSSAAFLEAVRPRVAVISTMPDSDLYPGDETLARLEAAGAQIWRTDIDGNVTVLTDGLTFTVNAPFLVNEYIHFLPLLKRSYDPFGPLPAQTP